MEMKFLATFVLTFALLAAPTAVGQDQPKTVSLIELIANPGEFEGKLVTTIGFLTIDERALLAVHREDAEHGLPNAVLVVPSEDMKRNKEKFNRMYVIVVGVFRGVPAEGGSRVPVLKDIKECAVWSNPTRPRSHGWDGKRHLEP